MPHPLAYVFKRELLLHPVLRLGDGAAGHDPHRPQPARRGLEQGRRAGPALHGRRATGSSCSPKARARRAAARAPTRPAPRGWRSTTGVPVVPIAVTSARCWPRKSFLLRPGVVDVSIGPPIAVGRPRARRADARGRSLDRGRDAPPRPRGLPAGRSACGAARVDSAPMPRRAATADRCSSRCSMWRRRRQRPRPPAPCRARRRRSPAPAPEPLPRRASPSSPRSATRRPTARSACGEHLVAYELRRARRRSIGFVVGAEGLAVSAPRWVGAGRHRSGAAREGRLDPAQAARAARARAAPAAGGARRLARRRGRALPRRDGDRGARPARHRRRCSTPTPQPLPGVPRLTLHVGLPHDAPRRSRSATRCRAGCSARRGASSRSAARTSPQQLGVRMHAPVAAARRRRAGAAPAPTARSACNWRLVHFALPTIDYVVAHELAHLREMNHSPRFWDVVRSVLPDYERVRGSLKDDSLPVFD